MEDIRVAFIGLGCRGYDLLSRIVLGQEENVVAVCDLYPDRVERAQQAVREKSGHEAQGFTDYTELLEKSDANTVVIATGWEAHTEIALAAMEKGKNVAMEVGGAYDLSDCYRLVETQERTGARFAFLENCCFGKREMMVLNMVKQGVLGEIVHCSGGYMHDLRDEVAYGKENRHYRLKNYLSRNCENYPTHELGPIMKVLDINHGNRMLTLTSTASKAAGMHDYIATRPDKAELADARFAQGDVITTVIRCARGETIVLTLDTTLPRFYSRGFTVHGTKGLYEEATDSIFLDNDECRRKHFSWSSEWGNAKNYEEDYMHPVWKEYLQGSIKGGHDGIDWLEFEYYFKSLRSGEPFAVDVYDAAAMMAITPLSEASVARGGAPVEIPDFTHGKWHL